MSVPLEPGCYSRLFAMTSAMGGMMHEAREHNEWDQGIALFIASNLIEIIDDCALSPRCVDEAYEVAKAINVILDNPGPVTDPDKRDEMIDGIGMSMSNLTHCLFDAYAITSELGSGDERLRDWPDEGWMAIVRPERVNEVR
jgi:hypothetical protein